MARDDDGEERTDAALVMGKGRAQGDTPMRMNGWQRLWVVVAVIWGLGVVAVGYTSWTEIETRKAIAVRDAPEVVIQRMIDDGADEATIQEVARQMAAQLGQRPQSLRDRVKEMQAHNVSEDVIVTFINKYDADNNASAAKRQVAADNNASAAKRQVVWQSAAWGAVPLIVLYGFGWAFAWVRRGFRPAA